MSTVQDESPGPHVPPGTGSATGQDREVEVPQDEAELAIDLDLTQELIADAEAELVPEASGQPAHMSKAERLKADHLLVTMVIEEGVGGPREAYLLQQLVQYARPVLKALLRDGRIFAKCSRLHRPVGDEISFLDWSDMDRDEIAHDMISDALPVFRKSVFEQRRWAPEKGASLATYFVNACALQFPAIYRKWNENRRRMVSLEDEHIEALSDGRSVDPALQAVTQDRLARALGPVDPQIKNAVAYYAAGFTMKEAAERAGITEKRLEGALARLRKKQAGGRDPRPGGGEGQC